MRDSNLLTRAEFHIMHYLWGMPNQTGYAGDILKCYEDPKPAYTTIATFLKILERKKYIKSVKKGHKVFFKAIVSRQQYAAMALANAKDTYFDGSLMDMMRFFLAKEQITKEEAEQIIALVNEAQQR